MRCDKRDFEVIPSEVNMFDTVLLKDSISECSGKIIINVMRLQLGVCSFIIPFNQEEKSILSI